MAATVILGLMACCLVASCAKPADPGLYKRLQDSDPSVRLDAIVEAGQVKDKGSVNLLIDGLGDSDGDVRLMSFVALRNITGQTLGYHYYDPPQARKDAIVRWRQWLKDSKFAAAQQSTTQSAATAAAGAQR